MTILFTRAYRLVPRGKAGLACDDDGVTLGPLPLVEAGSDASGGRFYRMRPVEEITRAFRLAYGSAPDEIERYRRGLAEVTQLLTAGEDAQARIRAVLLAAPEIAPEGMAKLARASALRKANPDWPDQPRNPAGSPEGANGRATPPSKPRVPMSSRQLLRQSMSRQGRNALLKRTWLMRRKVPTGLVCRSRTSWVCRL